MSVNCILGVHCDCISEEVTASAYAIEACLVISLFCLPEDTSMWQLFATFISGVPTGGFRVFKPPPEIPKGPPKSCQTQPDCENC